MAVWVLNVKEVHAQTIVIWLTILSAVGVGYARFSSLEKWKDNSRATITDLNIRMSNQERDASVKLELQKLNIEVSRLRDEVKEMRQEKRGR